MQTPTTNSLQSHSVNETMNMSILQLNGAMTACENIFGLFYTKVSSNLDTYCKKDPRYIWSILILEDLSNS